MRIDTAGALTLYAVGIDRVPRRWKDTKSALGALVEPDDSSASLPHLIERIVISGAAAGAYNAATEPAAKRVGPL